MRTGYGSPWFCTATTLQLSGGLGRPGRLVRLLGASAARPGRLLALIALVWHTPSEAVTLSSGEAGCALRAYFNERFMGVVPRNRLCRGVLLLPRDHREYVRGRRRQALRTNLRRARERGIICRLVAEPQLGLDALAEILANRMNTAGDPKELLAAWEHHFWRQETTAMVAFDSVGRPLAIAVLVIDCEVCLIQFAVASSHEARWALHDHVVSLLIARRARYLLAEGGGPFGALGFEPELHHYQHLLGYQLRHLIPG